ncbi:MAG: hypothetical protein M3539_16850 [Acidobacteriota bacterium]|nr:hypothetical protein [Acidobacteriota bacterium]
MNSNIHLIQVPVTGNGGIVWSRLHSEREDICEALLKESTPTSQARLKELTEKEEVGRTANWHRELLQARLRKIDDALDRLMAGSFGNCCKCGRWIEDTKLDFDPAIAFCIECWQRAQRQTTGPLFCDRREVNAQPIPPPDSMDGLINISFSLASLTLETLAPFDTICVRTRNSDYRIFLLDPKTGRALVEGGVHFAEPVEAVISGSGSGGCTIKNGEICTGLRLEMWVKGQLVSTSPIQSVRVEYFSAGETTSAAIASLEM